MKTDICYVISHGFAARMLLQTGLIRQLAQGGKRVAIITPDPEDENLALFREAENVEIYGNDEKIGLWGDDYLFKRKYFLEDIRKNPALWEKHIYEIFYSPSIHPWRRVRAFYYYAIHKLIPYFPSIRERFIRNEHRYLKSRRTSELLTRIDPELVVATYPVNFLEAKILYAARAAGIRTLLHLLSWDNITSKGKFPMMADHYIAWGNIMRDEFLEHYDIPPERIHICGVPHFDQHVAVREQPDYDHLLRDLGLDPGKPYLFFAMSSPRFAPREIDIIEGLSERIEKGAFGEELQLIVRPHPQNVQGFMADPTWIGRLQALASDRIAVDFPRLNKSRLRWSMQQQDMDRLSNLLAGCRVCLNSGSTVSIDALMLNKPVILTSFDAGFRVNYWRSARRLVDYTHLRKFVALGGARVVRSTAELDEAITGYLQDPDHDLAIRRHALTEECFTDDGQSTQRVLRVVRAILNKNYQTA
ncbi:glycosyltransferase family protein [Flavilitoribacter nigricans]|uniref:UDP-glycosyltransferase n=1 Tax=Flavilitoribacter nigricans (strain ATCC 23147 / DSM 23189 / NBRC 102662 / NCIMB 1420 / SS-2) TaxID=1122177 RepID=A0A2D0NJD0_FLAN2|nr:CDP-glycerol glycerophosphotransferase family protein [Flavilitoribacter nigricans]PHN08601.1 hypothetical protein CRP01_01430 [Flavilitoribacter nigricans DSM 23189 = NBRC 102662]